LKKKNQKIDPFDEKAAEKAALSLIKYRIRSEKELFQRLKMKGFSEETSLSIIEKFKDSGLLNDELFAYLFSYDKLTLDKKGPMFIKNELKRLGVEEKYIDKALNKISDEIDLHEIATEIARKYYTKTKDELKTRKYLYRRGFEPDIINCVIEDLRGDQNWEN
jgi:regulatory protein